MGPLGPLVYPPSIFPPSKSTGYSCSSLQVYRPFMLLPLQVYWLFMFISSSLSAIHVAPPPSLLAIHVHLFKSTGHSCCSPSNSTRPSMLNPPLLSSPFQSLLYQKLIKN